MPRIPSRARTVASPSLPPRFASRQQRHVLPLLAAVAALLPVAPLAQAENFYISYSSPADVRTQALLQQAMGSNTTIVWELSGDTDPLQAPDTSLLRALRDAAPGAYRAAYWTDWGIYDRDRARGYEAYFVPGAIGPGGRVIANPDFDHKAELLEAIHYAFLEIAPDGTVYFNDPWSDLRPDDPFCRGGDNPVCSYANTRYGWRFSAQYGNFEALVAYRKPGGGALDKFIAIGGHGHDDSFELVFGDGAKLQRLVDSVATVLEHYGIDGVDLDYENPAMSHAQSLGYLELARALDARLGAMAPPRSIRVTTLAGPAYLRGDAGVGFAPGVLRDIAALPRLRSVNLMSYDFYGAFNHRPGGSGRTALLANSFALDDAPEGVARFSVQESLQVLIDQGVPPAKAGAGVATYGRALMGIDAASGRSDGGRPTGLYAAIPDQALIPGGDLDSNDCDEAVSPLGPESCSGSFTYHYIREHFGAAQGFKVMDWPGGPRRSPNGSSAYSDEAGAAAR